MKYKITILAENLIETILNKCTDELTNDGKIEKHNDLLIVSASDLINIHKYFSNIESDEQKVEKTKSLKQKILLQEIEEKTNNVIDLQKNIEVLKETLEKFKLNSPSVN